MVDQDAAEAGERRCLPTAREVSLPPSRRGPFLRHNGSHAPPPRVGGGGGPTPFGRGSHPAQIWPPEDIGPEIMRFLTIHPNLLDGELAKLHFGQPRRIICDGLVEITSFVTNHLFASKILR